MGQKCGYYYAYETYFSTRRVNDAGEPKINVFPAFWNVSEVKYRYYIVTCFYYKLLSQRKKNFQYLSTTTEKQIFMKLKIL